MLSMSSFMLANSDDANHRVFGSDKKSDDAIRKVIARRKSVLDLILEDSKSMNRKLGTLAGGKDFRLKTRSIP